jgi:hypothetical protein
VQHDGNVIARLIAAAFADLLRAAFRPVAAPCRVFGMASTSLARLDRGKRCGDRTARARIFFPPARETQAKAFPSAHYFGKTYFG